MKSNDQLPKRGRPAHWPVVEIASRSTILFVTVCVRDRRPLLARIEIQQLLEIVWQDANEWLIGRYVLMPDHVHLFCAPSHKEALPLSRWIQFWKSQSTKRWPHVGEKPIWQSNFWDRQLRCGDS